MAGQRFVDKLYKDKDGHISLIEWPNVWLDGWLITSILGQFSLPATYLGTISFIGAVLLVIWALLEIFKGRNYLRRALGAIILAFTIVNRLKM